MPPRRIINPYRRSRLTLRGVSWGDLPPDIRREILQMAVRQTREETRLRRIAARERRQAEEAAIMAEHRRDAAARVQARLESIRSRRRYALQRNLALLPRPFGNIQLLESNEHRRRTDPVVRSELRRWLDRFRNSTHRNDPNYRQYVVIIADVLDYYEIEYEYRF